MYTEKRPVYLTKRNVYIHTRDLYILKNTYFRGPLQLKFLKRGALIPRKKKLTKQKRDL